MRQLWICGIAWAVVFQPPADAATLRVPWDYSTLHAALDVAVAGDTVLVGPGTYSIYEKRQSPSGAWINAIAFLKTGVTVLSEAGPTVTIIHHYDPSGDAGFYAFGQEEVIVDGFTFTGEGRGGQFQFNFGGLCIVRNCVFENIGSGTTGRAMGGVMSDFEIYACAFRSIHGNASPGIFVTSCTLRIEDSEFEDISPGAVRCWYDDGWVHPISMQVRGCRFVGIGGAGSAIYTSAAGLAYQYPITIEDSWFEGCVNSGTGPGAVAMTSSEPQETRVIRSCTFVRNETASTSKGGALRLSTGASGSPVLVEGCTFFGNSEAIPWPDGGSAVHLADGPAILSNNVFVANTGVAAIGVASDASVETQCNVFWANPDGNANVSLDPTDLIADPEFCNAPANDFTVQSSSPCLPQNNPACTTLIGAWPSGCGAVSVETKSWGRIKADYRSKGE